MFHGTANLSAKIILFFDICNKKEKKCTKICINAKKVVILHRNLWANS